MKVRIVCGGYGHKVSENRTRLLLRGETVDVDDAEAALLIDRGDAVAVATDSGAGEKPECGGDVSTSAAPEDKANGKENADSVTYSMDNTAAELKAIMEAEGLKVRSGMAKQEMIDALDAHFAAEEGESTDDDEQPPELNTEGTIV